MKVETTSLNGVLLITPPTIFNDFRGCYVETYNARLYQEAGIRINFIQDDISVSARHVLRGLHGDAETWKLVSCLYGQLQLVVVNFERSSPQYLQWESFLLSDQNCLQVLIPPNFANGHLVLSDQAIFHYKQSAYYNRKAQFSLAWNDPQLKIIWQIKDPILSERDKKSIHLRKTMYP